MFVRQSKYDKHQGKQIAVEVTQMLLKMKGEK